MHINTFCGVPTNQVEQIIAKLKSNPDVVESEAVMTEKLKLPMSDISGTATIELYIDDSVQNSFLHGNDTVENAISDTIRKSIIFKPKRVVLEHTEPTEAMPLFFDIYATAYVYVKLNRPCRALDAYLDFCKIWSFNLNVPPEKNFRVFSRLLLPNSEQKMASKTEIFKIESLDVGKFLPGHSFSRCPLNHFLDEDESYIILDKDQLPDLIIASCEYGSKQKVRIRLKPEVYGRFLIRSSNPTESNKVPFFLFTAFVPEAFSGESENGTFVRVESNRFTQLLADFPVIRFELGRNAAPKFANFCSKFINFSLPIFDSKIVTTECLDSKNLDWMVKFGQLEFEVIWNLLTLKSARKHWLCDSQIECIAAEVDSSKLSLTTKNQILKLISAEVITSQTPLDLASRWKYFQSIPPDVLELSENRNPVPDDCTLVKRVIVTPTRVVYRLPYVSANNRLLRLWKQKWSHCDIISVIFADEQFQTLKDESTFGFVRKIVRYGLSINVRSYAYLCASGSQLRSQRAYFAYPPQAVNEIRDYIIRNAHDLNVAKYTARLGLFCSADNELMIIKDSEFAVIDDVRTPSGQVVSDGSGFICRKTAEAIAKDYLKLDHVPAAFQVRFAGMKGVLVTDFARILESHNSTGKTILFRDSMNKFDTSDRMLTLGSYSKFLRFGINREFITLLDALKKRDNLSFRKFLVGIQEKGLETFSERFRDKDAALDALSQFLDKSHVEMALKSGLNILIEPFWLSLIRATYKVNTWELRAKTRIELEKAALLMGIPDPMGTLQDNEVFVNLGEEQGILEGEILIFRNPGLHPGDIRKVTAVNKPELKRWKNVIVMPCRLATFSLSAQCSGGDLDGDKFAVVWEPELVNLIDNSYPALDYDNLSQSGHQADSQSDSDLSGGDEDLMDAYFYDVFNDDDELPYRHSDKQMAKFFRRVLANDALGRVATMHLALCDIMPLGACDPIAIELAKSQSLAVDFPKTGILPAVPRAARTEVSEYPDFMGKPLNVSYPSKKVLGELYRRCCAAAYNSGDQKRNKRQKSDLAYKVSSLDKDLLVDGFELYINEANQVYESYKSFVKEILVAYTLVSDAELMLERAVHWSEAMSVNRDLSSKTVAAAKNGLKARFKNVFNRNMESKNLSELRKKASAWYYVAYTDIGAEPCISFPWIVGHDFLCSMKREAMKADKAIKYISKNFTITKLYGQSAAGLFEEWRNALTDEYNQKLKVVDAILKCFHQKFPKEFFQVVPYGSVPLFVHTSDSDVDVCIRPLHSAFLQFRTQLATSGLMYNVYEKCTREVQNFWLEKVLPLVTNLESTERCEYKSEAKFPIIKLTLRTGESMTDCDLSADDSGYRKTTLIQSLFAAHPGFFLAFWALVSWARASGVIKKSSTDDEFLVASAEFYLMVIKFCFEQFPDIRKLVETPIKLSMLDDSIKLEDTATETGHYISSVFDKLGKLDGPLELEWPIGDRGEYVVKYSDQQVTLISQKALAAKHCLAVTRDVKTVVKSALAASGTVECVQKKRLPRNLAVKIADTLEFHALSMSARTGAHVKFIEDSRHVIFIEASGTAAALQRWQEDYFRLKRSQALHGFIPFKVSRYFIEGSTLLLVQQAPAHTSRVTFKPSCGPFQIYHLVQEKSIPVLISNRITLQDWKEEAWQVLASHLNQQLNAFPYNERHTLETLHIGAGFGCFYTIDTSCALPPTHMTLALDELKASIEKARRNRKTFERPEFKKNFKRKPVNETEEEKGLDMITLGPSNTHLQSNEESVKTKSEKRKAKKQLRKKGLSNSFCPGMFVNNYASSENVENAFQMYQDILDRCGYHFFGSDKHFIKITVVPSTSYVANITLDQQMKIIKNEERRLNWAHVTILHGNNEIPKPGHPFIHNHDVRIRFQSSKLIEPGTDLFDFLFPTGKLISPVSVDQRDHRTVKIEPHFEENKDRITHVRVIEGSVIMEKNLHWSNNVIGSILGEIQCGTEFGGNDFEVKRTFCELYLKFETDLIRNIMSNNNRRLNRSEIDLLSKTLIHESLLVSQALRNQMSFLH